MTKPFEGVFGDTKELRLIELLLPLKGIDFNITELAKEVNISRPTATRVVKKFVEHKIMNIAQKKGGVTYYAINPSSSYVTLVENLNNLVIEDMLDEKTLYEINDLYQKRMSVPMPLVEKKKELKPEIQSLAESPFMGAIKSILATEQQGQESTFTQWSPGTDFRGTDSRIGGGITNAAG